MASRVHLSGVVVCQDNESTIGAVAHNLLDFCDELVVLDGGSRDRTREIAASRERTRVHEHPFDGNIAAQKNRAMDLARGDWIFILDTDELIGERGRRRIRWLTRIPGAGWWSMPRYWLVPHAGGVGWLDGPNYYRDRQLRLFRNLPQHRYDPESNPIHHTFEPRRTGLGRPLRSPHIFHYTFLLQDRERRARKYRAYLQEEPDSERIHSMYLWEDRPESIRSLPEPLPGLLHEPAAD